MTREQYLLLKLIEELGEAAKDLTKAMQFGGQDFNKKLEVPKTNFERVYAELDDVMAHIEMLNADPSTTFNYRPNYLAQDAKKQKCEKYYLMSVELGMVKE